MPQSAQRVGLTEPVAPEVVGVPASGGDEAAARIRDLFEASLRAEAAQWEGGGGVPASVFSRLGGVGAFDARWPDGARSPGRVDIAALIVRETALASVGAGIAISTHMEAYFRALARCEYGDAAWAEAIAGRAIGAVAVTERAGGSNPTNCETLAERSGDGWVLHGHKQYVSNMRAATDCVVFARTARRSDLSSFTLYVVPTDAPGITATPHEQVGARASGTWMVTLDGVQVGDDRRVGGVGSGLGLLLEFLRAERVMAASGGLAVAELCFEIALAFAEKRQVGGARLIQQQAIAHRLASLATSIAAGRALVSERLAAAQRGRISSAEAAQLKLVLARLAWEAADEAVQILGGRGFTEETPLAQLWRDVRIGRIGGGTDEIQLEIIAQSLRRGELSSHPAVAAVERSIEA
ncbi:MAG: acyl-CoA dehydrogenase [Actinomycetota bacterium]|nr:acyl-CoA dehydrogenase [Actinomycetota bacterium]